MRKRILALLLAFVMTAGLLPTAALAEEGDISISSVEDLKSFRDNVNNGNTYEGKTVLLTANLDLSGESWTPIGTDSRPFKGTFDGQKHVIYGLTVDTSIRYCGLFGRTQNAIIQNLGIENGNVKTSNDDAAILLGGDKGGTTVQICYVTGAVTADGAAGGLVSSTHGSSNPTIISNCYARVALTHTGSTADVSGIASWNYSRSVKVTNCFSACIGEVRPIVGWSDGSAVATTNVNGTFFDKTLSPNFQKTGFIDLGKTSSGLKTQSTYEGWDFNTIWDLDSNKNGGYPYLRGFTPGLGGAPGSISVTVKDSDSNPVTNAEVKIKNGDTETALSQERDGVYSGVVTTTGQEYDIYVNGTKVDTTVTQNGSNAASATVTAPSDQGGSDDPVDPSAHSHPVCGVLCSSATRPTEETHGKAVTFQPITIDTDGKLLINGVAATASYDSYELPQGSYYLDGDVTLDKPLGIASSATVNLCLNGYKLSMKNGVQNSVILLKSSRTLNLCDCYLEGTTHSGQDYYHTYTSPVSNAQKTVQGGLLTGGNSTSDGGGAIYLSGGILNMYGGTIAGNRSADKGGGVCVAYSGEFNMYGGSIRDNACDGKGGGVYVANGGGTFTLSGRATIGESDGVGNSAAEGGGVYLASSGTFNMNGGSVCNNTATTNGGGVYYDNGSFNVSGEVIINSNTVNSKDNNIYLASGRTITVTNPIQYSYIHVTTQAAPTESSPVNITGSQNADYSSAFSSDDSRYVIQDNDLGSGYHQVRLVKSAHTHTWATAWTNNDANHWHECTAQGCDITDYATCGEVGAAYTPHGYDNDQDTTCNTCGYTRTLQPSGATLAQWLTDNELTVKGVRVTADNAGNILSGDPVNDGKVKLELVNGRATLTLDNANIIYEDSWPKIIDLTVNSDNDQYLDIKVVGTVNLVSKPTESWGQGDGIRGGSMGGTGGKTNFRIEGGTLNIKNDSSRPGTGFYTSGTLTVAGADTVVNIDSGTDEEWSRPILGKAEDLLKLEDGLAVTDPANGEKVYNYTTKDWYLSDGNRGTAHKLTIQKPGAQSAHSHAWATAWANNSTHHWRECEGTGTCDITANAGKNSYGTHTWDAGKVAKEPTATTEGVKTYTCTVCSAAKTEPVPIPSFDVSGKVTDSENKAVAGAAVKLMRGRTQVASTTTNASGDYSFTNVTPSSYNVVAEQTKDGITKTMTILVTITNANQSNQNLKMPSGNVNSMLEVKGDDTPADAAADVSKIVVGELEKEAESHKEGNSTVTVTMTVEGKKENDAANASAIKTAAGSDKKLEYLEIKVEKKVEAAGGSTTTDTISTTKNLLTIVIPFNFFGKQNVAVYRYHGSSVDTLTTTANGSGERIELGTDSITLYVKNFSTYAIGYTESAEVNYTVTFDSQGGSAVASQTVAANGKVTKPADPARSGCTFGGWYKESACMNAWNFSTDTVTANTTLYAKWTSSGGGSYHPTTYTIDIPSGIPNGTVSASPQSASSGTTVTITVTPDEGYEIDAVTVTDKNGKEIPTTNKGDGKFTFTMPDGKVTVSASFTKIGGNYANCLKDNTCPVWDYSDASVTAWYHDGVHYCIENGLMSGYGNNKFGPEGDTSRAMIATILWRLEGGPEVNYILPFDDVAEGAWYTEAIRWAAESGVVSGYGNGKFGPGDTITREQLAAMLYRYEQHKGGGFTGAWMFPLDYADADLVSSWAYEPMCWTTMNGIISGIGNGQLDPKGKATRAQVATMIMRFCEKK